MYPAIRTVAVVGAGTMGQGIVMSCLASGYPVQWFEMDPTTQAAAGVAVKQYFDVLVGKGKMQRAQADDALARLTWAPSLATIQADLTIEAIVEKLEVKQRVFQQLEGNGIMASNTSSLSVDAIAQAVKHKDRVAGLHFFNPAHIMKLVEVVAGTHTAPPVVEALRAFVGSLGKTAVTTKDSPGFIVNRVARHFYTESFYQLEQRAVDERGLDALMRSTGFKMGPCELSDLIGHDVNYAVTTSLFCCWPPAAKIWWTTRYPLWRFLKR
ncbi:MAG: 3-hydroxyacyl-CoA dehydrogenase NAD-binding domain-containing protein [Cyclobacteriaceae bacterium]|nr:3-hydroxyacyl-CoA dehydrogenase NAD-binding domain-containing protein [Cyclobacteriaceae bacterium]